MTSKEGINAAPEIKFHQEKGNGKTVLDCKADKTAVSYNKVTRRIINALEGRERTARELAKSLNMTSFEIGVRLMILARYGLVTSEYSDKHARVRVWKLNRGKQE